LDKPSVNHTLSKARKKRYEEEKRWRVLAAHPSHSGDDSPYAFTTALMELVCVCERNVALTPEFMWKENRFLHP